MGMAWLRHECAQKSFTAVVFCGKSIQGIHAERFATLVFCRRSIQSIKAMP